jgi:hypothetical protein
MSAPSSGSGPFATSATETIYRNFPSRDEVYTTGASVVIGFKDHVPMVCVVERSWAQDNNNIQLPKVEHDWEYIDRIAPETLFRINMGPQDMSFLAMGRTLIATLTRWNTNLKFGYLPGIQPLYESTPPIHDRLALNHWRQDRFTNTETRVFVYRLEDTVDPSCEWNDFQGERLKMYLMPFNEAFARCQNRLDRNLYTMAAQLLLTDPKWYFPKDHTIPGGDRWINNSRFGVLNSKELFLPMVRRDGEI